MNYEIKVNETVVLREIDVHEYKTIYNLVKENKTHLSPFLPFASYDIIPEDYIETIEEWKKGNIESTMLVLGVFMNDRLIGVCSFNTINRINKSAEIGYWLSRHQTGKGLMTSCVKNLMEYGFHILGLNRIVIKVDVENTKSIKIPERLGFVREARMKEYFKRDDRFYDGYLYRIIKSEWAQLR